MTWPTPQFSRSKVNKAGRFITDELPIDRSEKADFEQIFQAYDVVNNWRLCHGYPINTFQATLRNKLKTIDSKAIVAQRLKRMPSIIYKLQRFKSMLLSRMQDIGGLRAVVHSLKEVRSLEKNYRDSKFKHELVASRDYIASPKTSGYRSVHLIYRYKNPRAHDYDGLTLELQIRTRIQHEWATAVETMGTFLEHALKSSEGPDDWLQFFALTGSAFAHIEKTEPVPGYETLTGKETYTAVLKRAHDLSVQDTLMGYSIAAERIVYGRQRGSYHLIILDLTEKQVTINSYSKSNLESASKDYGDAEQRIARGEQIQAVLVSAGSIDNLRKAYPNYFLDTRDFILRLEAIKDKVQKHGD